MIAYCFAEKLVTVNLDFIGNGSATWGHLFIVDLNQLLLSKNTSAHSRLAIFDNKRANAYNLAVDGYKHI